MLIKLKNPTGEQITKAIIDRLETNVQKDGVYEEVGRAGQKIIRDNIIFEGRPNKWADWSPRYAEYRASLPYPDHIGLLYGNMLESIEFQQNASSVDVFSELIYTNTFDTGHAPRNQPARPLFVIPLETMPDIADAITRGLRRYY